MVFINENYLKIKNNYLFAEIGNRTQKFIKENPDAKVIKLGIGDTTQPLSPSIIKGFHVGVDDMSKKETYKGYPPYKGYSFLRNLIVQHDYEPLGVKIDPEEIFVSDGAKGDTANILDIFGKNIVAVTDPSYPVYVTTNVMAGNTGSANELGQYENLIYLPCTEKTNFLPKVPDFKVDIIYLCSPNNPTGTVMNRNQLKEWVNFAKEQKAIIFFDCAYEKYIIDSSFPRSIYEIEGAKEVAIEFRSYSKTAGFTGVRCAYTIVPKELMGYSKDGEKHSINNLWFQRVSSKYNGVSYPVQKAAAATYSEDGIKETNELIKNYQENAKIICNGFDKIGFKYFGGINSPYIWLKAPNDLSSWDFFDLLLEKLHIVGTPGSGFGPSGAGYFRLTSFGDKGQTIEAMDRIVKYFTN